MCIHFEILRAIIEIFGKLANRKRPDIDKKGPYCYF